MKGSFLKISWRRRGKKKEKNRGRKQWLKQRQKNIKELPRSKEAFFNPRIIGPRPSLSHPSPLLFRCSCHWCRLFHSCHCQPPASCKRGHKRPRFSHFLRQPCARSCHQSCTSCCPCRSLHKRCLQRERERIRREKDFKEKRRERKSYNVLHPFHQSDSKRKGKIIKMLA